MTWERATLGRTGLEVGRVGLSAGYGRTLSASVVERSFEHGLNYLYWGSIRWRTFGRALANLKPQRDRMVLVLQSYSRIASLMHGSVERALRRIGYDYSDVVLLGMWNRAVPARILDAARRLRERGLVRHIAVSSHNRPFIPSLAANPDIGILHVRYNAAHTGAETEVFPQLPRDGARPGVVSFTATSWAQLLSRKRLPAGERVPTAADCYRFVLANSAVDVCMTGPKDDQQATAALDALRLGPMSDDEMAWMRRVGKAVHG
ncbi:MAG: aldo/keto reductase [Bryobacteraceae bacterium]|jgi:aryl-alcohol dehydrogenase-like predicted oxidoreductase